MRKLNLALAGILALPAFAATAVADEAPAAASPHTFTGNVTLASEYLYRGIAQNRGKPALQGGFDYAHSSGFYLGTWGSNISWISDSNPGVNSSLELDVYGGYKHSITGDLGFDVGVLTYNYPGTNIPSGAADPNTHEIYGALTYKWLTAKYSRTVGTSLFGWTKTNDATAKTDGSGYFDLTANYDLGSGYTLVGHGGHQDVNGRSSANYTDWKLGINKDMGFGTIGVAYSTTNAKGNCSAAEDYCFGGYDASGKNRVVLSFSKSL